MKNKAIINFSGGIITANQLRLLATIVYRSDSQGAFLSNRQQFIIPKVDFNDTYLNLLRQSVTITDSTKQLPNITCSNNAGGLMGKNDWAYNQDTYIEILRDFKTPPKLSISFISPYQTIEPIFSSQLNFIISEVKNYWLLVLQKDNQRFYAPFLLETSTIHSVVKIIENHWKELNGEIFELIFEAIENKTCSYDKIPFPYITREYSEGFIKTNEFEYALNIYSLNHKWDAKFLESLGLLLAKHKLRRVYITSRKSLLIKHIPKEYINEWHTLLSFHSISIRHSEIDHLWSYPQDNKLLKKLRNRLIKAIAKKNKTIYNLSICLQENNFNFPDSNLTITINKNKLFLSYNLTFYKDFDYRSKNRQQLKNLNFEKLLDHIINLSRQHIYDSTIKKDLAITPTKKKRNTLHIYQCPLCLTQYNELYGSPEENINEKTLFKDLPESWQCPLCSNPKNKFTLLNKDE